jgi:LacI family transcriptional regulator
MKININEVARKAGVSIATVSRAFSKQGKVRGETRDKILRIAREMQYKPSPIARGLSKQITDTIGVILPELVGEFFMDIIHGIDEEAHRSDKFVLVASSHSERNVVETLIDFMSSGRVDGVILMAPQMHRDLTEIIRKSRRPIVLINACKDLDDVVNFRINNYNGAFNIINHLAEHGYKKIAIINGPKENCDAQERYNGYIDSLAENNIVIDNSLVKQGNFTVKSGYDCFLNLMNANIKPDAVFAANDMMALGIYEGAKKLNLQIPTHVAVAGFDDIFLSRLMNPRLTTVKIPIAELSAKAVNYLLKMFNNEVNAKQSYSEILSTELIVGCSCGCKLTGTTNSVLG